MVDAGNAAATSAGRVTSAAALEGRTITQTLLPALTNGINRTRTLDEAQTALGQDATRQVASLRTPATFASGITAVPQVQIHDRQVSPARNAESDADRLSRIFRRVRAQQAEGDHNARMRLDVRPSNFAPDFSSAAGRDAVISTARRAPTPVASPGIGADITRLSGAASSAHAAIERLTEAAKGSRTAFVQLMQVADSAVRSFRQPNQAQVVAVAQPAPSAATSVLAQAPQASPSAMRDVAQAMSATATQASRVTATVTEANRAIAATPRITAAASAAPVARPPLVAQSIVGAATGQRVPTATGTPVAQLAADAGRAQTTVERLTSAARTQRSALAELAPAASSAAASYRQIASTPIRLDAPQGISATAAALANVAAQAESANRAVTALNRTTAPATSQSSASQTISRQTSNTTTTNVVGTAPSPAGVNAFAAATAHGTTAVNAFAAAQGRAAEAAQHLAEANARNEAAQARLTLAVQRAAAAQAALDNASRSGSGGTEAVATAQTRLQSAQAAVSVATANVARSQRAASEAAERHRVALGSVGRQATLTAFQEQQLHFQLHDFFVQVASGSSPLTAFIQQGSQLSGTFGGAGGAFRALVSQITPMRVLFGGVAGAVAALGYAFYEGSRQSKAFADAVVLTGNYAGQTEGKITSLTRQIASHGQVTASVARDAAQAALSSGQVGPQVFAQATEAIALYAQTTDQAAGDVAKDFAEMARSPSKWAEEHNRTLHFITAAQYEAIKSFEDGGKAADAQGVIYGALIDRLHKLDPNLGTIERTLRSVKNAWSSFWDAAYDIGRTETIESKIANLDARIREARNRSNPFAAAPQSRTAQLNPNNAENLEYQLQDALAGQARTEANAFNEAAKAEAQQAGITAKNVVDGYLKRGKAASVYKDELEKLQKSFKDAEYAGTPISSADQKVALAELKKEFTPPKNNEASQVLRAQLQNDLKGIQDLLQAERDALAFQQSYLQNVYQAGGVSLVTYYDQRRKAIADGVAAELDELDKEKARLQQYLGQTKDPSEKVQTRTRINEIDAEKSKLELKASRDTVLINEEESSSYRALSEQVTNYRANLLQMQGDEAGAAALRAQTVIANAKILAAQANGLPGAPKVDVTALERVITITDQFNEVQRQTSLLASSSSRAEEAYLTTAEQSGKSLLETDRGLYALRSNELTQLGALAQKAKELADASTDPKIKAFAADLALSYSKAASAIDPALNRLREANRELAQGIAQTIANAPTSISDVYRQRRTEAVQNHNGESRAKSALLAVNKAVFDPIAQQVSTTINKVLIQEPLQKYIEGQLKGLTEGDGPLAGIFKDALGIKTDPKQQALLEQTAAINASRSALDALTAAAQGAAGALNSPLPRAKAPDGQAAPADAVGQPASTQYGADSLRPPPIDSGLNGAQSDAAQSLAAFSKEASSTASDVLKLANAAGVGGDAMVRLPGIVGLFQAAVAAMQAGSAASSGGGLFGAIASLFGGGGGGSGATDAMIAAGQFHSGGIVGQASVIRNASASVFVGAPRYHTGGIVGNAADRAGKLHQHEVPAILMGGPKGKREEVLRADDPRHRDNLGMGIVARILSESKSSKHASTTEAKTREASSSVSTLMQMISGGEGKDDSSASVLAGLLDRLGVKQDPESAVARAISVRGARELGGPVSAGGMYRVNEKGPELLEVAGKQYLMMGGQPGRVESSGSSKGQGGTTHINVQVTAQPGMSRATAQQQGVQIARGIELSKRRNG
jgi:phage-related minor tail protein